ncbi:hypothetical protein KEM60_00270 [Austwickia sp. TVS 96-490-7B]|uniref:hypothetical protein n=1 Tax=Austwickia sp. TVS 96-490-7B TaxID=2830843 RepID=UPI001C59E1AD|nr:hypothetical protein [Austwickia sp. TVS 96-490-7B]MBW3084087.1 hypothetical protein [Austwickia sp. TVS 96-490-7B]
MATSSLRTSRPRRRRPRRLVVLMLTFLVLVAANTALEAINRARFPSTTVTGASSESETGTPAYWIFFPGFGIDFCPAVAASFEPVTSSTGHSFCVAPSRGHLDPAEISAAVVNRLDATRRPQAPVTVYLYGISMGGMIAYDVARLIDGKKGITVRALVFDSSPAGPDSVAGVKQAAVEVGAAIQRLPDLPGDIPNPLKGGPLDRFALHLGEYVVDNTYAGKWPLSWEEAHAAWVKSMAVTSDGMGEQLDYIESFYPRPDPRALPYASFGYLRAMDADADTTVDVQRATAAYAQIVAPHALDVIPVAGGWHASADVTVASYRKALARFIARAEIPTLQQIRTSQERLWGGLRR